MTSQIIAILYLNDLDHFIKEKLHIKYYIRYMDDGCLLSSNKMYLKLCLNEISRFLYKYKLELHPNKTKIINIKDGFEFLGFRFYLIDNKVILKLKNDTKKRMKKKCAKGKKEIIASYLGHLKWGSCNGLAKKLS